MEARTQYEQKLVSNQTKELKDDIEIVFNIEKQINLYEYFSGRPNDVSQLWSYCGQMNYLCKDNWIKCETSGGQTIVHQSTK